MWRSIWDWQGRIFPDDPAWRRDRTWGARFKFARKYGGVLWLTDEQNTLLTAIADSARSVQDAMSARLREIKLGQPWDDKIVREALRVQHAAALAAEYDEHSTGYLTFDRVAVRTAQRCRTRHAKLLPARPFDDDPSVRVRAGLAYEAPVEVRRAVGVRDGVLLGDLGLVYSDAKADDDWATCAYPEMTRMGSCWHIRFIWAEKKGETDDQQTT